jgi:hypothetical protein
MSTAKTNVDEALLAPKGTENQSEFGFLGIYVLVGRTGRGGRARDSFDCPGTRHGVLVNELNVK